MPAVSAISSQATFNSHTSLSLNGGNMERVMLCLHPKFGLCTTSFIKNEHINIPFQLLRGGFSCSPSSPQENSCQVSFHHHLRCCGDKHQSSTRLI